MSYPDLAKEMQCQEELIAERESPPDNPPAAAAPLVSGGLWKAIWIMSWPLMLTTVGSSIAGIVDVQLARNFGAAGQAAVGLSELIMYVFMLFIVSLGIGTTAIVSRAYGERNVAGAAFATAQSLILAVIVGLLLVGVALLTAQYIVPQFSKSAEVIAQTNSYLGIYALYLVPFTIVCLSCAAFQGTGNARIPLLIMTTEYSITIAGAFLTVLGNWPVPNLGIAGLAYSAVAGSVVAAILALYCISRSPLRMRAQSLLRVSLMEMRRLLSLGIPAAVHKLNYVLSIIVLFFLLSRLDEPTAALASWTIGIRVESFIFMPLIALGLAVSSIVGQNLGANKIDRALKAGWYVAGIAVLLMVVVNAVIFTFAAPLAAAMSSDPKTTALTTSYLRITSLCKPFIAVDMVLAGALQGVGDTKTPMWASLIANWIVRLPLAWFLAFYADLGPDGVWWALTLSPLVLSAIVAWRFQSRKWAPSGAQA